MGVHAGVDIVAGAVAGLFLLRWCIFGCGLDGWQGDCELFLLPQCWLLVTGVSSGRTTP